MKKKKNRKSTNHINPVMKRIFQDYRKKRGQHDIYFPPRHTGDLSNAVNQLAGHSVLIPRIWGLYRAYGDIQATLYKRNGDRDRNGDGISEY